MPSARPQSVRRNIEQLRGSTSAGPRVTRGGSRGILFYGEPGTGKTLVARALAGACAKHSPKPVTFFSRKGADCLGKFSGEAERTLRLLFEEVRPPLLPPRISADVQKKVLQSLITLFRLYFRPSMPSYAQSIVTSVIGLDILN